MRFRADLRVKRRNREVKEARLRLDAEDQSDPGVAAGNGFTGQVIAKVALAMVSLWLTWAHPWRLYETEVGEVRPIRLEDGSLATMSSNTQIRVDMGSSGRHIELIRGEALFEVARDPTRPFDVSARGVTTRAVGTAFDVRLTEDDELNVMVVEGRVCMGRSAEVQTADSAHTSRFALVERGQMASTDRGVIRISPDSKEAIDRKLAWTRGQLNLYSLTLAEAIVEINRYNKDQLEIGDPTIAGLMTGGTINTSDRQGFLDWLRVKRKVATVISGRTVEGATVSRLCGPKAPPACQKTPFKSER